VSAEDILPDVYVGLREAFNDCPDYYWSKDSPHPTSARALAAMFLAVKRRTDPHSKQLVEIAGDPPPRWPATVDFLDTIMGGFYGLTCFASMPGLGKSTLALASAIEAAASLKWNVLYINAEMGEDVLAPRLDQYLTAHPDAEDACDHMAIVNVTRGYTIQDLLEAAVGIAGDDRPILTVIDSINTTATLMDGAFLDNVRNIALFCMMARRVSRGAASFLVISELNRSGGAKGMNVEYWSDVVVKLAGEKEKGWVRMKLQKSRATAGEREERKLVRVHHTSRFLSREDLENQRLRAVHGAGGHLHLVEAEDELDEIW